jgi:hypothetical protein
MCAQKPELAWFIMHRMVLSPQRGVADGQMEGGVDTSTGERTVARGRQFAAISPR